jgi:predicted enzyme related to lactoylglutathione lyase
MTGKRGMAGLMALPDDAKSMGAPPHWLSYIGTPNVDDTAKQAASLGARILKAASDIPNVGRFAVLQDPQGASFGIFTGSPDRPVDDPPAVGDFSWHELATSDYKAALTFYKALFGWQETNAMDMGPQGTYQMFGLDGKTMGGAYNAGTEFPGGRSWWPYIKIQDAKRTAGVISKLGAKVINGPMEVPGGDMIAQGLDLQGIPFAVHSIKAAAKSKPAKRKSAKKAKAAKRRPAAKKRPAARKKAVKRSAAKKSKKRAGRKK